MKAVLLNDTRPDSHHGSERVVNVVISGLERAGVKTIATAAVGSRWWENSDVTAGLAQANVIVINGEGTLHHGGDRGRDLLRIMDDPQRRGLPVVLVNALYQDNPESWGAKVAQMALVQSRDSRSAAALAAFVQGEVSRLPDMTLCAGPLPATTSGPRQGIVFGDSVYGDTARALAEASNRMTGARLVPIVTTFKRPKGRGPVTRALRRLYSRLYERRMARRYPALQLCEDQAAYAAALEAAELHVTGRFHAVCFSILTRTPFVAIRSNSWKIEALLADMGLSPHRLIDLEEVDAAVRDPQVYAFSDAELTNIARHLEEAENGADRLFAQIAALAGEGARTPSL